MKMLVMNRKIILSILVMLVLLCGLQGVSSAADPAVELQVETEQTLTEADLDGQTVTLKLIGQTWTDSEQSIENALTVTGIEGVTFGYTENYRVFVPNNPDCVGLCWGTDQTRTRWKEGKVRKVDDNTVTFKLAFKGDFDTDSTLTFTVEADAIENYDGPALTAEVLVTFYKGVSASAKSVLTEATLNEGVVTLTLSWDAYEADVATIINAVTVTGIDGVTIDTATVQRLSNREITIELDFARTNLDTDATLTFSVGAGAIADYTGDAFTAEILVPAVKEISASAASPLTEATLGEGVVTLTLSYDTYEADVATIINAVTVTGIDGVTIDTATVQRLSNREITIELDFARTNLDTDATLTFSVGAGAIADYTGDAFTAEILVPAVKGNISLSCVSINRGDFG